MKLLNHRGQSEVVSTVLLILIGIIAVTIVAVFVINFVNDQIGKGKCFDVIDKIEVVNNPEYTCYDETPNNNMRVQVHFSEANDLLDGFQIELGGADTQTIKILRNIPIVDGVTMYSQEEEIVLPGDNSERTYNITGVISKPEVIRIYPIMKGGKVCKSSSSINQINICSTF